MEKPDRDNFANMSLHGKLTVQEDAKVANTVEWFHLNATYTCIDDLYYRFAFPGLINTFKKIDSAGGAYYS